MTHDALNNVRVMELSVALNELNTIRVLASYQDGSAAVLDESVFDNATPQQRKWYERMKECAIAASFCGLPKYPEIERFDYETQPNQPSEYYVFLNSNFEVITDAEKHKYL